MTHKDRQETPRDLPARPKAHPVHPRQRTLRGLLAQGGDGAGDTGAGWVVGLPSQSQAEAEFAAVLKQLPATGFRAFTLSAWMPDPRTLRPVLLIGPVTHAAFRAAIPAGRAGWGWFSAPFLQRRGAKAEAWLGVPFLDGRLVPFPSESAPGGAGISGQPGSSALECLCASLCPGVGPAAPLAPPSEDG